MIRIIRPLLVALLLTPARGAERYDWPAVARVVAVGDVHGDYDRFVQVLALAGLVDAKHNWTGGAAHLVQLGDVPDRGSDTRRVMDLLMRLEKQARKAGGRVHALIGNHEAMNVYGDLRYTTPAEFAAFRSPASESLRAEYMMRMFPNGAQEDEAREQWRAGHPPGWIEHRLAWAPDGEYGKWILNHNVAVRIGDTLFVHGGIGPKYASVPLEEINQRARSELAMPVSPEDGILRAEEGPLWYRGLAEDGGPAMDSHVENVLRTLGVKRIVIGHTTTRTGVVARFDGRVILADVGLSRVYGGDPACISIEAGVVWVLHRTGKTRLPSPGESTVRLRPQFPNLGRIAFSLTTVAFDCRSESYPPQFGGWLRNTRRLGVSLPVTELPSPG